MLNLNFRTITNLAIAGIVLLALATAGTIGYRLADSRWQDKYNEMQLQLANIKLENQKLETAAKQITIQEVIRYVDRVRVVREKGQEIIREIPVYITPEDDARCIIPTDFIRLHNDAAIISAASRVPSTTGKSNAISARAETTTD